MTTYGFIGAGNMASAIVRGMVNAGYAADAIIISDPFAPAAQSLAAELGVRAVATNAQVASSADYLILAVKPQVLEQVLSGLTAVLAERQMVVVSIAAGVSLARLGSWCPQATPIIRVMPNVNAQIGAGMAAVTGNSNVAAEQVQTVLELFAGIGRAVELAEKDFAVFSAVAGAGPALVFEFLDALAAAALRHGIPKQLAVEIAAQTALGSARLVLERANAGTTPADLKDTVTSPAGTTIAGLLAAEEAGFAPAVVRFVDAVVARDRELGS